MIHLIFYTMAVISTCQLYAWTGISVFGDTKYQKGLTHLSYADPVAKKGGRLVLGWTGTFDSLNPFSNKGISPLMLESLVFQNLGLKTHDEVFSQYPSIAESFEVSKDSLSIVIKLNKTASFSDGTPITADDVEFSFNLFRSDKVNSFYKSYWQDIEKLTKIDKFTVKLFFSKFNPELPAISTQLSILPKHIYNKGDFNDDFVDKVVGSGPYVVKSFKRGASITYKKNEKFWGNTIPFFKGRYNFDEIEIQYYRDETAKVEAFKKGNFDVFICYSSKLWAKDLVGDLFDKGLIKKELWSHSNNQGSQGFYFNLRKPMFQNIKIRKAIALAFDFEWANETLFYGQYVENKSFFENSELKAIGSISKSEYDILKELKVKYKTDVPDDVFNISMGGLGYSLEDAFSVSDFASVSGKLKEELMKSKNNRLSLKTRLKLAVTLLKNEGYSIKNGVLVDKNKQPLVFTFLLSSASMARVVEPYLKNLKKIGVQAKIEVKESSIYQRKLQSRDFDIVVLRVGQSQSPGNEQIDYWHSKTAHTKYSRNHAGLENKAVDDLIHKIIYAKSRAEQVLYTKSLDRLLYHLHIAVHHWHHKGHRVAYWDKFNRPKNFPLYYYPTNLIEFMWEDHEKVKRISKAMGKKVL